MVSKELFIGIGLVIGLVVGLGVGFGFSGTSSELENDSQVLDMQSFQQMMLDDSDSMQEMILFTMQDSDQIQMMEDMMADMMKRMQNDPELKQAMIEHMDRMKASKEAMMDTANNQMMNHELKAIEIVNNAIDLYGMEGLDAFEKINNKELNQGELYPFVIDTNLVVRAHGSHPNIIGDPTYLPKFTNTTPDIIKQNIVNVPFMWVEYEHHDPDKDEQHNKRSYFVYVGDSDGSGYIFGSGFHLD